MSLSSVKLCVLISFAFSLPAATGQDEEMKVRARSMFQRMYESRLAIKTIEVDFEHNLKLSPQETLNGCERKYSLHFDYENDRFRGQLSRDCPNWPEAGPVTFAFADGRFLEFRDASVQGREFYGKSDRMYEQGSLAFEVSADPRLFGVLPVSFSFVANYTLSDLASMVGKFPEVEVRDEIVEGSPKTRVRLSDPSIEWEVTYWFDPRLDGLPTRIVMVSGETRDEGIVEWSQFSDHSTDGAIRWYPAKWKHTRNEAGVPKRRSEFVLGKCVLGQPVSKENFSWAHVDPPDGLVVREIKGKSRVMKEWDATLGEFVPWQPVFLRDIQEAADTPPLRTGLGKFALIVLNLFIALALVVFALRKRKDKDKRLTK